MANLLIYNQLYKGLTNTPNLYTIYALTLGITFRSRFLFFSYIAPRFTDTNFLRMQHKVTVSLLLSLLFSIFSLAQTIHPDHIDGEVYIKLTHDEYAKMEINNPRDITRNEFTLLGNPFYEHFKVKRVYQSFHFSNSEELLSTLRVEFQNIEEIDNMISAVSELKGVEYIEPVPFIKKDFTPNDLGSAATFQQNNQWYLHRINAQDAWDITKGSKDVVVAIVDDAVEVNHPDLQDNIVSQRDVANNTNDASPPNANYSHGTHVGGIAGAVTDNNIGIASIGFNTGIMAIRASNSSTTISHGYEGLTWAAENGADVINSSWGSGFYSQTAENAINQMAASGAILVSSAGNGGGTDPRYPAGYDNVIAVANLTSNDSKANSSEYGDWIDISAPGSGILGLWPYGNYNSVSGTSMSSPMVAGLLGLMKSISPDSLTNEMLLNCLYETADNIDDANPNYIGMLGAGRINAGAACQCVAAALTDPPSPEISIINDTVCPGNDVYFLAETSGGLIESVEWTFEGGTPSTSTELNPTVVYSGYGSYEVTLKAINQFGDSVITKPQAVSVSQQAREVFFEEDFENGNTVESMDWTNEDPDNISSWEIRNVDGTITGNRAAAARNYFIHNEPYLENSIVSPEIDLRSTKNVELSFEHAYRRQNGSVTDTFKLSVLHSETAAMTNDSTIDVLWEDGSGTLATGTRLSDQFTPGSQDDWCFTGQLGASCFTYNLSEYDTLDFIQLRFTVVDNNGNNFYLNNVQLTGTCSTPPLSVEEKSRTKALETFKVYPNPAKERLHIENTLDPRSAITGITVFDASGRIIMERSSFGNGTAVIETHNFSPGYYIVRVEGESSSEMKKVMIK